MTDAEQDFTASVFSLENFCSEYIQVNRAELLKRFPRKMQPTSLMSSASSEEGTSLTGPVEINDYIRVCRMYCIMLWTYWDAFKIAAKISSNALDELMLIRHCLVHHEGDIARYSQTGKEEHRINGQKLLAMVKSGKPYVSNNILIIGERDLAYFTRLVKTEFATKTGAAV